MMPASGSEVGSRSHSLAVTSAPACYRVLMRDRVGLLWTPLVVAGNVQEAEQKAVVLFPHRQLLAAEYDHQTDGHLREGAVIEAIERRHSA